MIETFIWWGYLIAHFFRPKRRRKLTLMVDDGRGLQRVYEPFDTVNAIRAADEWARVGYTAEIIRKEL